MADVETKSKREVAAKVQELAAASGTANAGSGFSLASRARKS